MQREQTIQLEAIELCGSWEEGRAGAKYPHTAVKGLILAELGGSPFF